MGTCATMFRPQANSRRILNIRHSSSALKEVLSQKIPAKRELLKELKTKYASKSLGEVKVENTLGGMRGLKCMGWEGSQLDPVEGIRFHGYSIPECQDKLPKGKTGTEMLPESMFWLLLTGEVPTESQIREFSKELASKSELPSYVSKMLDNLPKDMHPMTQFSMGIAALNHESKFAKLYEQGMNKADYWEPTLDDTITLLAKLPTLTAKIYNNCYLGGKALG